MRTKLHSGAKLTWWSCCHSKSQEQQIHNYEFKDVHPRRSVFIVHRKASRTVDERGILKVPSEKLFAILWSSIIWWSFWTFPSPWSQLYNYWFKLDLHPRKSGFMFLKVKRKLMREEYRRFNWEPNCIQEPSWLDDHVVIPIPRRISSLIISFKMYIQEEMFS